MTTSSGPSSARSSFDAAYGMCRILAEPSGSTTSTAPSPKLRSTRPAAAESTTLSSTPASTQSRSADEPNEGHGAARGSEARTSRKIRSFWTGLMKSPLLYVQPKATVLPEPASETSWSPEFAKTSALELTTSYGFREPVFTTSWLSTYSPWDSVSSRIQTSRSPASATASRLVLPSIDAGGMQGFT